VVSLVGGGVVACSGRDVSLGRAAPAPYVFGAPVLVPELATTARSDNPTLTSDLLEIYFTSNRNSGNGDLWFARRPRVSEPFGGPLPLSELNGDSFETSSAIASDGLTLWFGSDRAGGLGEIDIWSAPRASRGSPWSAPALVPALSSPASDIPRPPGQRGLVMPMASARGAATNQDAPIYQTYFATRAQPQAGFAEPLLLPELAALDRSTVDAFLTDDGLALFFSSSPLLAATDAGGATTPTSDLYVTWRRSVDEAFVVTAPLEGLNTRFDERDPWLAPDGATLFFTSDRDGVLSIYSVAVSR